jgi:hypothetical protein
LPPLATAHQKVLEWNGENLVSHTLLALLHSSRNKITKNTEHLLGTSKALDAEETKKIFIYILLTQRQNHNTES